MVTNRLRVGRYLDHNWLTDLPDSLLALGALRTL